MTGRSQPDRNMGAGPLRGWTASLDIPPVSGGCSYPGKVTFSNLHNGWTNLSSQDPWRGLHLLEGAPFSNCMKVFCGPAVT